MKSILAFGVMAVVLFTGAAGLSIYLQTQKTSGEEGKEAKKTKKAAPADDDGHVPPSVRPEAVPGAEEKRTAGRFAADEKRALDARADRLAARERQIEVIMKDLQSSREEIERVQREVAKEFKLLSDRSLQLDKKAVEIAEQKRQVDKGTADLRSNRIEASKDDQASLVKQAVLYESMAPETAADVLMKMAVEQGQINNVVKLMANMKPAKAAKVFGEMKDTAKAAEILSLMQKYKAASAEGGGQ